MPEVRHAYSIGLIRWELILEDETLTVRAPWGRKVVPRGQITKLGIARDGRSSRGSHRVRIGKEPIDLSSGPHGLVVVWEEAPNKKNVNFTFDPSDDVARRIVEALLADAGADKFVGVGQSHAVRLRMGLGGGDILAALGMIVAIGSVVALLMYLGVLD